MKIYCPSCGTIMIKKQHTSYCCPVTKCGTVMGIDWAEKKKNAAAKVSKIIKQKKKREARNVITMESK